MFTFKAISMAAAVVIIFAAVSGIEGAEKEEIIYTDVPETVDAGRKYLFYMHGAWIEKGGLDRPHPKNGLYKYNEIVSKFAGKGFVVISEARLSEVKPGQYAEKVANQVRRLIDKGVPPENITVIGHSKGGLISLLVSSTLGEEKVNFVLMAACGKEGTMFRRGYERFLKMRAAKMKGRILSIYDSGDLVSGTCEEIFSKATGIESKEIVLETSLGHKLFYKPEAVWVNEVVKWADL